VTTAAQGNITSVGTLTSLSVTGNISAGNVSATTFTGALTGAATTAGTVTTAAQGNITSVGTLTGLTINNATTAITNGAASGSGNIGAAGATFNTIFAKATTAQYADLAENYTADANYTPGTVVVFGGEKEITVTQEVGDERVAGVISTDPAHLMNAACDGLPVALRGRVPVNVIGPVVKGDSLVTATTSGFAISVGRDRTYGQAVFAKALETNNSEGEKVITAVIL
jgi:molecular chaperone DnaK (HSP70)